MIKSYYSLGLMSGTSGDGIDASIIQSDGDNECKVILDKYFKYGQDIYENIHNLKDKINNSQDLNKLSIEIKSLDEKITLFHSEVIKKISLEFKSNINLVGFHGQTIFHNSKEKISMQLGNGKLLSKLIKKKVVYNFRENDLKFGGEGAPLTPIFHKLLEKKFKNKPVIFINIGGIVNETTISKDNVLSASDIGPGMCLIDKWIRTNSKKNYDINGDIAKSGSVNKTALNNALEDFFKIKHNDNRISRSFDTKDFDISYVTNLSLADGAATLTEFTFQIIYRSLNLFNKNNYNIIFCGGGRKNNFLINRFKEEHINFKLIDDLNINGDFIESQAFAYLAIRSYLNLPISFPGTTGVKKPCLGGTIIDS